MRAIKWGGGILLALLLLSVIWGAAVEPRMLLDVEEHEAAVPNLPSAWEGRTIALLADLQVGMWLDNTGMVAEAVEEALAADPALVLIAGDFVYKPDSAVVREAAALMRPLTDAGVPVFAVLGNHDYSLMKEHSTMREGFAQYLEAQLRANGIRVLENEAVVVGDSAGTAPLYVVGIGSEWAGRSRPEEALAGVPAGSARIVFMHNPVAYRELPAGAGGLTLAAHTHGGQIRLPMTPSTSWMDIARPREVVADGWATDSVGAPGNQLYVNRGIGFSLVPVRLFCPPELTLLTLRRGEGGALR